MFFREFLLNALEQCNLCGDVHSLWTTISHHITCWMLFFFLNNSCLGLISKAVFLNVCVPVHSLFVCVCVCACTLCVSQPICCLPCICVLSVAGEHCFSFSFNSLTTGSTCIGKAWQDFSYWCDRIIHSDLTWDSLVTEVEIGSYQHVTFWIQCTGPLWPFCSLFSLLNLTSSCPLLSTFKLMGESLLWVLFAIKNNTDVVYMSQDRVFLNWDLLETL